MLQFLGMKKIPLIAGNWKMHPATVAEAIALAKGVVRTTKRATAVDILVAPAAIHVMAVKKTLGSAAVLLSAQDVSAGKLSAQTGQISPLMLQDAGVSHVIIGHSESRARGETDEQVNAKIQTALAQKLTPIVCVGERERDNNAHYLTLVREQVRAAFNTVPKVKAKAVVIAYEPIWAIGTGKTATPADAEEMKLYIQKILTDLYDRPTAAKVKILYGGSVKAANAEALFTEGNVDGFLIGGASLDAEEFGSIAQTIHNLVV